IGLIEFHFGVALLLPCVHHPVDVQIDVGALALFIAVGVFPLFVPLGIFGAHQAVGSLHRLPVHILVCIGICLLNVHCCLVALVADGHGPSGQGLHQDILGTVLTSVIFKGNKV